MPIVTQQIANFGASSPEMARIIIQTDDIAKFTTLSKDEREELLGACQGLAFRLANARTLAEDLRKRSDDDYAKLKAKAKPGDAFVEIPYATNLDIMFEGYFYNAKNIIRDLGAVTRILLGRRFGDASDWCSKKGGESEVSKYLRRKARDINEAYSTIRELIEQSRQGLEMIVRVRNALEHPGGYSGTILVTNFKARDGGVAFPSFKFEGEAIDYSIVKSMDDVHQVLLHLVEAVVVFGLMFKFPLPPKFGIRHIKPEDRNPVLPKAFEVVLLPPDVEARSTPFDGKRPRAA